MSRPPQRTTMTMPDRNNRLAVLAAEIRDAHRDVEAAATTAVLRAIDAGQRLLEAKAALKHGQWLPWLDSLGLPARTAQDYARLAQLDPANTRRVAHLGLRAALKAIAKPRPVDPDPAPSADGELVDWARTFTRMPPEVRLDALRILRDEGHMDFLAGIVDISDAGLRKTVLNTVNKDLTDPGWFARGAERFASLDPEQQREKNRRDIAELRLRSATTAPS